MAHSGELSELVIASLESRRLKLAASDLVPAAMREQLVGGMGDKEKMSFSRALEAKLKRDLDPDASMDEILEVMEGPPG